MCPRCCFKEISPSLEVKKAITLHARHLLRAHNSQLTPGALVNAFERTTFSELAVFTPLILNSSFGPIRAGVILYIFQGYN
mgnify:CR=1 FL=1